MKTTLDPIQALRLIIESVVEAVAAAGPSGAPAGTLYTALMAHGATLNQFESLMAGLVRAGKLRKEGQLYFAA